MLDKTRIRSSNDKTYLNGPILYWMDRDQRVEDNWGLLMAQAIAEKQNASLIVVVTILASDPEAYLRHYGFMLKGLVDVEQQLSELAIPFYLICGQPAETLLKVVNKWQIGAIVTDFSPLLPSIECKKAVSLVVDVPFYEVDAHNVVPAWLSSPKQEVGAYTLRPKLHRLWPTYLCEFPKLNYQKVSWTKPCVPTDWSSVLASLEINNDIAEVDWLQPGSKAGQKALQMFITERLEGYATKRNIPGENGLSELSPYLHYGHLAPQRVALEVQKSGAPEADKEAYIEELLVRRELSDNFCLYNTNYTSLKGAPNWAQVSLSKHQTDSREFNYSLKQLEQAETHDDLWNAAQLEMCKRGKMHGYLRMYWAKKILEWSVSAEEALEKTRYLNDKYFLDGRDPNGYVGMLWAIAGLHDRPWFERDIFGQVRYMNYNGAKRKFSIVKYIAFVDAL